jgi:hypothetical protein
LFQIARVEVNAWQAFSVREGSLDGLQVLPGIINRGLVVGFVVFPSGVAKTTP